MNPQKYQPLNGTVLVRKVCRADIARTGAVILLDKDADPSTTPYHCEIIATGPGRMSRENGRVPSVGERGWAKGDRCICLLAFPRLAFSDQEHFLIDDFDLLCRVKDDTIEPWFGRMAVDPVSIQETISETIIIPVGGSTSSRAGKVHSGKVEILSPWLKETSEQTKEGPRQAKSYEIVEDMPFKVGERVAYRNRAVWEVAAHGRKYLLVEMGHVLGRLADDAVATG